jgi:hypothetical protein
LILPTINFIQMKSIIFLLVFTGYSSLFAQWQYPATKTVEAKDTYWGVTYKDPYRWLEDMKDPEGGSTDVADVSWNTRKYSSSLRPQPRKPPGTVGRWSPAAGCPSGTRGWYIRAKQWA